jgi:nucleoside-diphosphate-sugar epimerase
MKTILISGGGGYLGTQIAINLLKKNKVLIYDKFYFPWLIKNKNNIPYNNKLSFIKKDISKVNRKDFNNVDIVCDLAAIANDPSCELNKKITWKVNYHKIYLMKMGLHHYHQNTKKHRKYFSLNYSKALLN